MERSVYNPHPGPAFGLLAAVQVTLILAITVIAIALPAVGDELRLPPGRLALVSAGYGLAFSGLLLFGGRLADTLGQRRVLVTELALFGLASLAAAGSPSFAALLCARLAQGAGAALAAPAAMALLGAVFPEPGRHARALAIWGGLATAGIVLSGITVTWGSWRWAFLPPALVAAVVVAVAHRLLPPGTRPARSPVDLPGAILATAGIVAVSYGLVTAGDRGWNAPVAGLWLLVGLLALAGFMAVESRTRTPLLPLPFLRSRRRLAGLAAILVAAAGHASIGFFLALYLQRVRGLSPLTTTAAFLPILLLLPVAGAVAARLLARARPHLLAAAGLAVAAVGLVLIGRLEPDTPYLGTLLAGLLIFPVGAALAFAGATVVAAGDAGGPRAGLAGGLVNTAVELGPTVGLSILVFLAGTRTAQVSAAGPAAATSAGYAFALTAAATALAAAAAGVLVAGRRRSPQPPPRR